MESRHCGQDKRIFFSPVHNASTPCSLQSFGIRCIASTRTILIYPFEYGISAEILKLKDLVDSVFVTRKRFNSIQFNRAI